MNRTLWLALLLITSSSAVVSCGGSDVSEIGLGGEAPASEYRNPPTPVIRPGSLVAADVDSAGNIRQLPDGTEPGQRPQNWDFGDQYVYWQNSSSGTEVEQVLLPGNVVMGLGARVAGGAVTRMRLFHGRIRDDWSWDPAAPSWAAWVRHSSDDGQDGAELGLGLPKPFVAVGVGMGISNQNVRMISIARREYSPALRQLVGPKAITQVGNGGPELYWDTSLMQHAPGMEAKMVIVGLGLRENADNLATLRVWAAYLD